MNNNNKRQYSSDSCVEVVKSFLESINVDKRVCEQSLASAKSSLEVLSSMSEFMGSDYESMCMTTVNNCSEAFNLLNSKLEIITNFLEEFISKDGKLMTNKSLVEELTR